jgi:transcriptional regulator with XRE-family HTH domain
MDQLKRMRLDKGLSQAKLAARADIDPSTVNQIERGAREASPATLRKLANALDVGIADLLEDAAPEAQTSLPLEGGPPLEMLHFDAGLQTNWLIMPKDEWVAAWPSDLAPEKAMRIVQELAVEFEALEPKMTKHERELPWSRRAFSGQYKQAWRRFFDGIQAAHACGVAHGLITPGETLNDLAETLGVKPVEPAEERLMAAANRR